MKHSLNKEDIAMSFRKLQLAICQELEKEDGSGKFLEGSWESPGGMSHSHVLEGGTAIEKGGVNFSVVHREAPDGIISEPKIKPGKFFVTGLSIVIHPRNPMAPIIHMNIRYFEMDSGTYWFGGGIDLTPHYIFKEDAKFFHHALKKTCDRHDMGYYPKFKLQADEYFFIKHRDETRGIGGIFFDHLNASKGKSKKEIFDFVLDIGNAFAPIYRHLLAKNKNLPFNQEHKNWQYLRRGRYVEFNLVWDKGTRFGLDTKWRTESVLMSLPPIASWKYDYQPDANTKEAETLRSLKKEINWLEL